MRVSFDSALHGRCDRAPVDEHLPQWATNKNFKNSCVASGGRWTWSGVARGGSGEGVMSMDMRLESAWATIWCTFCVYVSRGMGYRQPSVGSA